MEVSEIWFHESSGTVTAASANATGSCAHESPQINASHLFTDLKHQYVASFVLQGIPTLAE